MMLTNGYLQAIKTNWVNIRKYTSHPVCEENTDDTHFEMKNEFENAELCKENFKAPRYFPYINS